MGYTLRFRKPEKTRIGEILVQKNLISVVELEKALAEQRISGKKIGEILIEKKLISQFQLKRALQEQYWRNLSASFLFSVSTLHPAVAIADTAIIPFSGYLAGGCGVSLTTDTKLEVPPRSLPLGTGNDRIKDKDTSVSISCTTGGSTLVETSTRTGTYRETVTNVKRGDVTTTNTLYSNLHSGQVTIVP